jgi:hypothetical protein
MIVLKEMYRWHNEESCKHPHQEEEDTDTPAGTNSSLADEDAMKKRPGYFL